MGDNTENMAVKIMRLSPLAVIPHYATPGAAGMDLSACIACEIILPPHRTVVVGTGIALALPLGYEAQIRSRSGLAAKQDVSVLNAPGTIDSDYRGEVGVILHNHGSTPRTIQPGDRIAQMVIAPVAQLALVETDELDSTERGAGGFGSTGI